jgi:four helix bundle protein
LGIPKIVIKTVLVFRARSLGGNRNEKRRGFGVFKLAHQLALKTYSTTKTFPRAETFSLVDQMRRAATSVGMNLMEGAMRLGSREYRQFVGIARGSAGEVCYQLLLAKDLKYISNETYQKLRSGYDRVIQMLFRLSQSLNR